MNMPQKTKYSSEDESAEENVKKIVKDKKRKAESSDSEEVQKPTPKKSNDGKSSKKVKKVESDNSDSEQETKQKKSKKVKKEESSESESEQDKKKKQKKKKVESESEEEDKPVSKKSSNKSSEQSKPTKKDSDSNSKQANKPKEISEADANKYREEHLLSIEGSNCPAPYISFDQAGFPDYINEAVESFGFANPTPIQAQGWPLGVSGRDIIGIAETGSGKTLAFGVPAIMHIMNKPKEARKGPSVVVMAPTRELAQQIEDVIKKACVPAKIGVVCVFGGVPKTQQADALRSIRPEVIIATPGRLMDFMQDGSIKLNNVSYLVLDEADRMLDMGFHIQISTIIKEIPKKRQTLMYSATWPMDVQKLAHQYFKDPIRIIIGNENLSGAKKIVQKVEICENFYQKKQRLFSLLSKVFKDNCKILIFMLYKKSCEAMTQDLKRQGWNCESLHGDKSQMARDQAVANFKSSKCPILVATDVAARGLDIKDIKYVINVEMPLVMEDYVHRIGRTGRAGVAGEAYTLFSPNDDKQHARQLVRIMQESGQKVDDKLVKIAENAPVTKPRKTSLEQTYGDYAKGFDADMLNKKPTKITFDNDD